MSKITNPLDSIRHQDKRTNIPTEELRDFVAEEEAKPQTLIYPRDPSLDPQLVWKGKDEQDSKDLEVPCIPIYIQEKIHPQALIEDLRRSSQKENTQDINLFADFNGLSGFDKVVDFYKHQQNWSNRFILGDSLLVMNSLAEKEGLKGKVQMIYLDPPYGIKFNSNWQVSTRKRDVKDGKLEDATRQPEQIKAFRDTWELGIHSYLSYLRDRLVVARELLTESGSIFVQMGDENVHLVRCLMDEVFGSENFQGFITFRTAISTNLIFNISDYLIWYSKNCEATKKKQLRIQRLETKIDNTFTYLNDGGNRFKPTDVIFGTNREALFEPYWFRGKNCEPPQGKGYTFGFLGMKRMEYTNRLWLASSNKLYGVGYETDFPIMNLTNLWEDTSTSTFSADKIYVIQTNIKVIQRCLLMTTDPGDLVLDPTCGSGTTAFVAEQWGRRWITIDTSRVALALARTRLMSAKYPYYLMSDSPEGMKKEAELAGTAPQLRTTQGDIKKGFVYKKVPHITLKAIANNEEIDVIHAKWQEKSEPIRAELNRLLNKSWEEWEIPRDAEPGWPQEAIKLLSEWWKLRLERQKEIDASISRRAEMETLYDQPYEDNKRIRVTGPFTVESVSPHRMLTVEDKKQWSEGKEGMRVKVYGAGEFCMMIIENLKKAGVQNTIKNERLKFDRLEAFPGEWINAAGEYTESDGKSRRIAVCIGPEYGTVSPELVKEAAKEAVKGIGFDMLIICGFHFDPHTYEEAKRYGKLTILMARINNDLSMGNELLKKTGAGNLFTVFGEPDIEVRPLGDGKFDVEIKGLDVYDPTTGQIRNNTTDDIACWFIDTDYNGESFFVRHAYFCGADEPYNKLKRALKAQIDEGAWSSIYSTVSRPFDKPESGKIAVKVINHYGDEVLKVFVV